MDNTENNILNDLNSNLSSKQKEIKHAKAHINSLTHAAITINNLHESNLDPVTIIDELRKSSTQISNDNIAEIEMMLMTQAKTLDYLFYNTLNKLVGINMVDHLKAYVDIALRAQNQCRKTLSVLAELKNPRKVTFIEQQNNAINQQINDKTSKLVSIPNVKKVANELLSEVDHETMDFRREIETIKINPTVETLETCRGKND